jgi:hypothetical protein
MTSQKTSLLFKALSIKVQTSVTILPNILLPNILRLRSKEKEMCVIPVQVQKRMNNYI